MDIRICILYLLECRFEFCNDCLLTNPWLLSRSADTFGPHFISRLVGAVPLATPLLHPGVGSALFHKMSHARIITDSMGLHCAASGMCLAATTAHLDVMAIC